MAVLLSARLAALSTLLAIALSVHAQDSSSLSVTSSGTSVVSSASASGSASATSVVSTAVSTSVASVSTSAASVSTDSSSATSATSEPPLETSEYPSPRLLRYPFCHVRRYTAHLVRGWSRVGLASYLVDVLVHRMTPNRTQCLIPTYSLLFGRVHLSSLRALTPPFNCSFLRETAACCAGHHTLLNPHGLSFAAERQMTLLLLLFTPLRRRSLRISRHSCLSYRSLRPRQRECVLGLSLYSIIRSRMWY